MHKIITIGREFGSGGRELGRRLSDKLGFAYYDQEIITEISKRTDLSEEYVKQITENRPVSAFPIHVGISFYPADNPVFNQSINIYAEQHKLLQELAEKSDCIIVGRCADQVLESCKEVDCLSLFICAPFQWRVKHRMEIEGIDEKTAAAAVDKFDKQREKYYTDRKSVV